MTATEEKVIKATTGFLIFTVYGPFAFWEDSTSIRLMAPRCPHILGVISTIGGTGSRTSHSKFSFAGRRCNDPASKSVENQYVLDLNLPGSIVPDPMAGESRILKHKKSEVRPPKKTDWYFWLTIPKPKYYALVNPAPSIVEKNPVLAAGLRFIYEGVDPTGITLFKTDNHKSPSDTGFTTLVPLFPETGIADMQLHLCGRNRDDDKREEAWDCFFHLTECLGLSGRYHPADPGDAVAEAPGLADGFSPIIWIGD